MSLKKRHFLWLQCMLFCKILEVHKCSCFFSSPVDYTAIRNVLQMLDHFPVVLIQSVTPKLIKCNGYDL